MPPLLVVAVVNEDGQQEMLVVENGALVARHRADPVRRIDGERGEAPTCFRTGDSGIELDVVSRTVRRDGHAVALTRREFGLLHHLMARPRTVVSRRELLQEVWQQTDGATATISVHMRSLRTKLERDPKRPVHLITVRGVGYRFEP